MVEAAEAIRNFVEGRSRSDLDRDAMLVFALIRALEIVGEAANRVTTETRTFHDEIPWHQMIGMRNRLIHADFDTDLDVVWETVTVDVPQLLPRLQALLVDR